jgi:hypothetical protein
VYSCGRIPMFRRTSLPPFFWQRQHGHTASQPDSIFTAVKSSNLASVALKSYNQTYMNPCRRNKLCQHSLRHPALKKPAGSLPVAGQSKTNGLGPLEQRSRVRIPLEARMYVRVYLGCPMLCRRKCWDGIFAPSSKGYYQNV